MKILHIGKYFPPYAGGMETYLRDAMASLARAGIETSALVHRSEIGFSSTRENYREGVRQLRVTRAGVWARLLFTPISPAFPLLLRQLIKTDPPDILHIHMPNVSAFSVLVVPSARRIPWVIHWHSDVLASKHSLGLRLFYKLYRPFERALLRRCERIIATSAPYLASSEPLQSFRDKCEVIPLGLDPDTLPAIPAAPQASTTLHVLAIGRLTYYKGFEYLIRAVAELENIEVCLVGTGDLEVKLRQLARNLGVSGKISFAGYLSPEQLARRYADCDCLCLPSIERTEAFGLVLLEAMCSGRAVVASDVPGSGMGWVVQHGVTGLKTTPASSTALANAFRQLQSQRGILDRLGKAGKARFDQHFHIDKSTSAIAAVYTRIMSRAGPHQGDQ